MIACLLDPVLRWRRRVLWQVDKETARVLEKEVRSGASLGTRTEKVDE